MSYIFGFSSYMEWSFELAVWLVEPGYSFTFGQSLSVVAAATSTYPVLKLLRKSPIKLRELTKEDLFGMYAHVMSEVVFLLLGRGNLAALISKKYFRNRLTLPPYQFKWREPYLLPVTAPPTRSSPPAVPPTRIDTGAASSAHPMAGESSPGAAPSTYLDVPIPSSEMDMSTLLYYVDRRFSGCDL
ncbi:hypothetical protein B0H13DRAFT_2335758 [Mycena leptocephala]|nr:hypothetical protein B0H13DRAFT_2335758 [Mycena leptocephala]